MGTGEAALQAGHRGDDFLERFKALGCYLDDLCFEPVNRLGLNDPKRAALRHRGEEPLARRMQESPPQAVVVVMRAIEANVRAALRLAGLDGLRISSLPFPRPEHRARLDPQRPSPSRPVPRLGRRQVMRA